MLEFALKGRIRKVSMDDVEQLKNYIFTLNTIDEVRERVRGNIDKMVKGEAVHLVAEVNDTIVGNILLTFERKNPEAAHIWDIVVIQVFRGTGLVHKLIDEARKVAKRKGVKYLYTGAARSNVRAIKAYQKVGFKEYDNPLGEKDLVYVKMEI